MTSKRFCILLLALTVAAAGQNEDIPIDNDNQFPPDADDAVFDGSADGSINMFSGSVDTTPAPLLEDVLPGIDNDATATEAQEDQMCPKSCSCHFEGATENFVVDCSGIGFTEFPLPLDPKTTSLNIKNNKITEIPKDIATLTNLKVLNADNNAIMDLALGSVSALTQLTVLNLSNNRLIDYPKDLKNSIDLTKLEELNLGGNDIRTELNPETFSNFQSLHKLTLVKSTPELLEALCGSLKNNLEAVCTESCETQFYECKETPQNIEDGLIDAVLPAVLESPTGDDVDPALDDESNLVTEETPKEVTTEASITKGEVTVANEGATSKISGNSRLGNIPEQAISNKENIVASEAPKNEINQQTNETDLHVGATTTDGKPGGVDKSVIGIIVAGMVVIVAGITIKKNWSSIRKRFSSTPTAAERAGANANGTTPEEVVPLQDKDKSPV